MDRKRILKLIESTNLDDRRIAAALLFAHTDEEILSFFGDCGIKDAFSTDFAIECPPAGIDPRIYISRGKLHIGLSYNIFFLDNTRFSYKLGIDSGFQIETIYEI